jgi:hypothetical protein
MIKHSFSKWECHHQCPFQYKCRYVDNLPSIQNAKAARGVDIHASAEVYIKTPDGFKTDLTWLKDKSIIPVLDAYRFHPNGMRHCEYKFALDEEWYCCSWKSQHARVRLVFDAARFKDDTAYIAEWKSGKPKDTHEQQREMYALGALKLWDPRKKAVVTTYYFDGTEEPQRLTVKPGDLQMLIDKWERRFETIEKDRMWAPRPGFYCKWCSYSKTAGGPCKFGG